MKRREPDTAAPERPIHTTSKANTFQSLSYTRKWSNKKKHPTSNKA